MNATDVIVSKLLKTWPESWKIFEESCQYSIDNNLDYIKGILLNRESKIDYNNVTSIQEQLFSYLRFLGYSNFTAGLHDPFFTRKGHESGLTFVIFLSSDSAKKYIAENNKWAEWSKFHGSRLAGPEPKRPMFEEIRYQDIYKEKR